MVEAIFPKAIAKAFHSGTLGIMDYYKLRNKQADICMRDSISDPKQHCTVQTGKQSE